MNLLLPSYIQNLLKINLLGAAWNILNINRQTLTVGGILASKLYINKKGCD
jgi:hypothetical protein